MERKLSLDELRLLTPYHVPGLARDLDERRVILREECVIEEGARGLEDRSSALGLRGPHGLSPLAPWVDAMPGRYRAWVLPHSGIPISLEPLDADEDYVAAHRKSLLALQSIDDAQLTKRGVSALARRQLRGAVKSAAGVFTVFLYFGYWLHVGDVVGAPLFLTIAAALSLTVGWFLVKSPIPVHEGTLTKSLSEQRVNVDGTDMKVTDLALLRRLVPGVRYRVYETASQPTFEPIAPATAAVGAPYR